MIQNLQEVNYMQKFYEYQSENMADFHKSLLLSVESLFAMKVIYRAVFHEEEMKINGICQHPWKTASVTKKCKPYTRLFIAVTISGSLIKS